MRAPKLKLNLDELNVESLAIPAFPSRRGTVRGHVYYYPGYNDTVYRETDPSGWNDTVLRNTEWYSCGGTCGTCGGTDCYA